MPHQASDGRQPAPGIADAYLATQADLQTHADAQQTVAAMNPRLPEFDIGRDRNRYVFVAAFDGTGNDAAQTLTEASNVHGLYDDFDRFIHGRGPDQPGFSRMHARYMEGPGTQDGYATNKQDNADGRSVQDRVFEMYRDLGEKSQQWKKENPDAEISVVTFGFSRGAVEAAEFASVVGKYGIQANVDYAVQADDDSRNNTRSWTDTLLRRPPSVPGQTDFRNLSDEVVAPGKVPIVAGLFDPVATGVAANRHDRELPQDIRGVLQITARDEHRTLFPVNDIVSDRFLAAREQDPAHPDRFANLKVAGCHSDIGGGYGDGKGLADSSRNVMGTYLNGVLGRDICQNVQVDPTQCVVHDSNSRFFQYLGRQQTGHWFADRTQDGVTQTPDGRYSVASGIDPNLHGRARVEMPSVNMIREATLDDGARLPPGLSGTGLSETHLDPRQPDRHTPKPKDAQYELESTHRAIDPTKLVLEGSARIGTLMDATGNPTSARILRDAAEAPEARHSILSVGDSAQGRLSAAVALAAQQQGMDRIGEVAFNPERTQLLISDRRDNHPDLVRHATVDIGQALRTPMRDTLRELDPALARDGQRPPTLYQQAHDQLSRQPGLRTDQESLILGAERLASQARSNGLTAIDAVRVEQREGRDVALAVQLDGRDGVRQSQPIDASSLVARQQPPLVQAPQQAAQQQDQPQIPAHQRH
jgi:hypothetical protein